MPSRVPSSSAELEAAHDDRAIRIKPMESKTTNNITLRLLPTAESIPPADNSLRARANRAPAYSLENPDGRAVDTSNFIKLIHGLFTIRHEAETIRLSLLDTPIRDRILRSGLGIASPIEPETSVLLLRESFWQGALAPTFLLSTPSSNFPLTYAFTGTGLRHPLREPKANPGAALYERWIPHLGQTFSLRLVDPTSDSDVSAFNEWQNNPRVAAAWLETGTVDEHRAYLERQTTDAHQMPVFGALDGEIFLYAEIYWVAEDHIAPYLGTAHPYDRGFHVLVGSDKHRGAHRVQAWLPSVLHYIFLSDARTQRIVMEPRLSNAKIIDYMCRAGGFCVTKWFDFPHKRSALLELSRERFFQLSPFHWEPSTATDEK